MSEAENENNDNVENTDPPESIPPIDEPFKGYQPGHTIRGVKIKSVVLEMPDFIVYRGEDQKTHFYADEKIRHQACSKSLRRSEVLQAKPVAHLNPKLIESFRQMVDQGLISALAGESETAGETLDMAQQFVEARDRETARRWYFQGSSATAMGIVLFAIIMWQFFFSCGASQILLAFGAGAVGAYLSVLSRLGKLPSDASSGRPTHYIDGFARVFVGALGGVIVGLAIRSKLIFAFALGNGTGPEMTELILLFCIVAGASERIVPNFIQSMETKAGNSATQEKDKKPPKDDKNSSSSTS